MFFIIILLFVVILWVGFKYLKGVQQSTMESLPVNRYPLLGSHDSTTGDCSISCSIPFVRTQRLNTFDQYRFGCRFFDVRLDISSSEIFFYHGQIRLMSLRSDLFFKKMLQSAVRETQFVVLYLSHYDQHNVLSIESDWKSYIDSINLQNQVYTVNTLSDLERPVEFYTRKGIYILVVPQEFVQDNYDQTVVCFAESIRVSDKNSQCLTKTCFSPSHPSWDQLRKYISDTMKNYESSSPRKLFFVQAFFQSPAKTPQGIEAITVCLPDSPGSMIVDAEQKAKVNLSLVKTFTENKYRPNVVIVDNAGPDSLILFNAIKKNFEK